MPHLLICLKFADSRGRRRSGWRAARRRKKLITASTKSAAGMD